MSWKAYTAENCLWDRNENSDVKSNQTVGTSRSPVSSLGFTKSSWEVCGGVLAPGRARCTTFTSLPKGLFPGQVSCCRKLQRSRTAKLATTILTTFKLSFVCELNHRGQTLQEPRYDTWSTLAACVMAGNEGSYISSRGDPPVEPTLKCFTGEKETGCFMQRFFLQVFVWLY